MKLVLPILSFLLVSASLDMAFAETPPQKQEQNANNYLTAEEEATRWPDRIARNEMGPLLVQRGPGKVVYSFWNQDVTDRLFDTTFAIAQAHVYSDVYPQKMLDEAKEQFLREFESEQIAWVFILSYDDDTVLPIAYRLNDRGVYEKQPADVAKSLVDQTTTSPRDKELSLRDVAEMYDRYHSIYFCHFYTREGRSIPYQPRSHDTQETAIQGLEEFLRREKPYYVLARCEEVNPECFRLTTEGMYRFCDGPICEALDIRTARSNKDAERAMLEKYLREDKKSVQWPDEIPFKEMGALLVHRCTEPVFYYFWNEDATEVLLDDISWACTLGGVLDRLQGDEQRPASYAMLMGIKWAEARPRHILILTYKDSLQAFAYRLDAEGIYRRQSAEEARRLIVKSRERYYEEKFIADLARSLAKKSSRVVYYSSNGDFLFDVSPTSYRNPAEARTILEESLRRECPEYVVALLPKGRAESYLRKDAGRYFEGKDAVSEILRVRVEAAAMQSGGDSLQQDDQAQKGAPSRD